MAQIRSGYLMTLHVNGRVIGTTSEHPFWVEGKGWRLAGELRAGDLLQMHDGNWLAVEGVEETGRVETVYNVEVEDFHTYFVGSNEWGFSVWAHNRDYADIPGITPSMIQYIERRMSMYARGLGDCNTHSRAITKMFERNNFKAVTRCPTGPGQHAMTLLPASNTIVDVTARQFARRVTPQVRNQFARELDQTGVWSRTEYNDFFRNAYPPHGGF